MFKTQTHRIMTVTWALIGVILYEAFVVTTPSIAGVTFMDNFDFEQRYRDVNECNPFHWHPLHLPEVCADMFEKLIRSKLAKNKPVRIMRERKGDEYAINQPPGIDGYPRYPGSGNADFPYPVYEIGDSPDYGIETYKKRVPLTPYEKMLELLKKDIKKEPSMPKIGVLPNLGPVAIYNQEISKKSENMIKSVATAYGKYVQASYAAMIGDTYGDQDGHQVYVWDSHKNGTSAKKKHGKKSRHNKNNRLSRTKTKVGNIITIVETLKPRRRRSALYYLGL